MTADRRRSERIPVDQHVEITGDDGETVVGRGLDMSRHGLLCEVPTSIPEGTRIRLTIGLSFGEGDVRQVHIDGVVVRTEGGDGDSYLSGVDFTTAAAEDRKMIERFAARSLLG